MPASAGPAGPRFHLLVGQPAPAQLSATGCGPTAMATARMLADPTLADWVRTGDKSGRAYPDAPSAAARFAAYQRLVHQRTNALLGPTNRAQLPWPRALGTPPWGVCRELEAVAAEPAVRYRSVLVRWSLQRIPELLAALAGHLDRRRPGVLYLGSATLPRHVTLLVPDPATDAGLAVHDPATGTVSPLDADRLARGVADIAGWSHPWFLIAPVGVSAAAGQV